MTLIELYAAKEPALRAKLDGDRRRLEAEIRRAALDGEMDTVDTLGPQLDGVTDAMALMNVVHLRQIVESPIQWPPLPADYAEALRKGQADLERWQRLERGVQTTIKVAGQVADGVSAVAKLVLKYGKYLV